MTGHGQNGVPETTFPSKLTKGPYHAVIIKKQPADRIIGLSALYNADPRSKKIDLGVGVYKDANGNTPVMRAIKEAEKRLWDAETTKTYTAMIGDGGFHTAMADLVLSNSVDRDRISFCATPGGTGAIHHVLELVKLTGANPTIWFSDPTWGNHLSIAKHLGMPFAKYGYFDNYTRSVNFEGMISDLSNVSKGDVVVLHGCCHNPTGANLNKTQWGLIADLLRKRSNSVHRYCVSRIWGRLRRRRIWNSLISRQIPRNVYSIQLFKEFWYLSRAVWISNGDFSRSRH